MAFSDRVRAWLKGESKRGPAPSKSSGTASRGSTRELEAFATSRHGVEAYLEPKTAIYSVTLLLVAGDGEYLRRPIDPSRAVALCGELNVPLYDASKVGYPRRMHDFEAGVRRAPVRDDELPPWPGDAADEPPGPPPPPPPPSDGDHP